MGDMDLALCVRQSIWFLQYLEHFMQKYALSSEPGYFLGSEYSFAETVRSIIGMYLVNTLFKDAKAPASTIHRCQYHP